MMLTGARAWFCASHKLPEHDSIHGHSYEVWAFMEGEPNVEALQLGLANTCYKLNHEILNDIIPNPTMENIARFITADSGLAFKLIRIIRPVEGLCCEWRP